MKTYRGVEVQLHSFLISALDGGETPTALPPRQNPLTHYIRGQVGPTIGPTVFEKKKKTLVSTGIRNPDGPVCNLVSIPNTAICKTHKNGNQTLQTIDYCTVRSHTLHISLTYWKKLLSTIFNLLKPELNPICYLLALLGAHHFLHVTRIRVKSLTFRLLMSYIYIYIYMEHPFLMFLDHTQRRSTVGRTPLDE